VKGMITISEPLPIKENIYTAAISEGNDNNMRTTSYKKRTFAIIPLTDESCVYIFSFTGSGSHIVIIPLTDDSCVSVLFYRKRFSYCYHSSH
jgi:hypothetical protein